MCILVGSEFPLDTVSQSNEPATQLTFMGI